MACSYEITASFTLPLFAWHCAIDERTATFFGSMESAFWYMSMALLNDPCFW